MNSLLHYAIPISESLIIITSCDLSGAVILRTNLITWGPLMESPDNFSGPKSCFTFSVFAFKIKISIILNMIQ